MVYLSDYIWRVENANYLDISVEFVVVVVVAQYSSFDIHCLSNCRVLCIYTQNYRKTQRHVATERVGVVY